MDASTTADDAAATGDAAPPRSNRFPPQIKYIIGNEAAERYSFYGNNAILTLFMTQYLLFEDSKATTIFHLFKFVAYFTPLIGGYIADRYWGKYRTIMTLSMVYVAGHATLAVWENEIGLYIGLGLIGLGAGGIKPCVSAHVGDQFTVSTKHLVPKVFSTFYFSINFGSFFATLITPWTRAEFGPSVAFGIPGVLMAIATLVFWMGRHYYIFVPPTGARDDTPGRVWWFAARKGGFRAARERFGDEATDAALAVLRVSGVLLPIMMFWALFDQTGSSWVLQASRMDRHGFQPDQLQALNPIMVMGLIPIFSLAIYPWLEKRGVSTSPLRRITIGMFVTALSFVAAAIIESFIQSQAITAIVARHAALAIDTGHASTAAVAIAIHPLLHAATDLSMFWQAIPYLLVTSGEILVSITALEFAYTQAPRSAKSTVMSVWMVTIAIGNLLTATIAEVNVFQGVPFYLFWAGLMGAMAVLYIFIVRGYKVVEYIESDGVAR